MLFNFSSSHPVGEQLFKVKVDLFRWQYVFIVQVIKDYGKKFSLEKVSSRRINLEGNTHAQEINASQLPV
jgi:hypothetical protein